MRDEDFGAALTLTEADDGIWSPPTAAPVLEPRDWPSLYEQTHARAETERARADAAEACAEELRQAEMTARSRAGSLMWQLDKSRDKLNAAVEEPKEVRRAAKGRAVLPGGSGAAGEAAFGSRRRAEQAQHDDVAAYGSRPVARRLAGLGGPERYDRASAWRHPPVAQGCAGTGSGEGHDRAAVEGERPAVQSPGAVAGAEGRTRGVARGGRGAAQVGTGGAGVAVPGERPAEQGAGTDAAAEGHDRRAAPGSRFPDPGDPSAEPGERPACAAIWSGCRASRRQYAGCPTRPFCSAESWRDTTTGWTSSLC